MLFRGALWAGKKLSSVEQDTISVNLSQEKKLRNSTPRKNKPKRNVTFVLILCGIVFFIAAMSSASSAASAFEETLVISIIAGALLGISIERLVSDKKKASPTKTTTVSLKQKNCDKVLGEDSAPFEYDVSIEMSDLVETKEETPAKDELNEKGHSQNVDTDKHRYGESNYYLERYAVMCNAYLEHQDEFAQYEERQSESH